MFNKVKIVSSLTAENAEEKANEAVELFATEGWILGSCVPAMNNDTVLLTLHFYLPEATVEFEMDDEVEVN